MITGEGWGGCREPTCNRAPPSLPDSSNGSRERQEGDGEGRRPSPSAEPTHAIAADPFLAGDDLTGIGPYGAFQTSDNAPQNQLMRCIDVADLAGTAEVRSTVLFEPDIGDASVNEHAVRFDDAGRAQTFADQLRATAEGCDPGDPAQVTSADRGPEPVTTRSYRWSRLSTPTADAGIGYYELGVAREANVVVVLEWSSMGNPLDDPDPAKSWVWTTTRLQTALDRAVD